MYNIYYRQNIMCVSVSVCQYVSICVCIWVCMCALL